MKYKGILLDIDNTLYHYESVHEVSLSSVAKLCQQKYNVDEKQFIEAFTISKKKVHHQLAETASSHNRLLYFQTMLEHLGINSLSGAMELYNQYWDVFLPQMKVFDGVYSLLTKYQNKICFVTDLTAHIQFRKIHQLNLHLYADKMVSSEEVGSEKPASIMFTQALHKLNLQPNEVCMIGDNFKKDIEGAIALGISAIWVNHEKKEVQFNSPNIMEVKSFKEILDIL